MTLTLTPTLAPTLMVDMGGLVRCKAVKLGTRIETNASNVRTRYEQILVRVEPSEAPSVPRKAPTDGLVTSPSRRVRFSKNSVFIIR
jgi:hypothetical protein